jgi:hypothetical protein
LIFWYYFGKENFYRNFSNFIEKVIFRKNNFYFPLKVTQRKWIPDEKKAAGLENLHDLEKYCPYCEDDWCVNLVRDGAHVAEIKTPVIDDRLYRYT